MDSRCIRHIRSGRAALVLVFCLHARGQAQDAPTLPDNESVVLNQPVSINGPQSLPREAEAAAALPAADGQTAGQATGPASVGRRPRQPHPEAGSPWARRAAQEADGESRLPLSRPTPWYRTGLGALTLVLLLIGAAVWTLRRWVPSARGAESRLVRVVARANLSPRHSAALVCVGRRFVLVGMTGERVNTLCEISDPEEAAEISLRTEGPAVRQDAEGFERLLIEEAADYRRPPVEETKETELRVVAAEPTRRPLLQLLQWLRALQSVRRSAG